jgi:AcrR family transcriptional regulator
MSMHKAPPTSIKPRPSILEEARSSVPFCAKPRVRDRIFETACDLFYKHGIREVGVDAIATAAGTNKMSFYRSFASKDELVAEYLDKKSREFWIWWDAIVSAHEGDARRQIEALFDAFVTSTCVADSRGCALANASVELAEAEHPGRQVALKQKAEMQRRFRGLAAQAGARKADELGDALMLLMEGGYLTRRTFGHGTGPLQNAALTARVLIDAYTTTD